MASLPWFGNQLVVGNNRVGARRQVFETSQLTGRERAWFGAVPGRIPVGQPRPAGRVWHLFVPYAAIAAYDDKVVREMAPAEIEAVKEWRMAFCARFDESDVRTLEGLSASVDRLWERHARATRSSSARR